MIYLIDVEISGMFWFNLFLDFIVKVYIDGVEMLELEIKCV